MFISFSARSFSFCIMRETIVKACSLAERVPAKTLCSIIQDSLPGELDIAGMIESVITFVTAQAKVFSRACVIQRARLKMCSLLCSEWSVHPGM